MGLKNSLRPRKKTEDAVLIKPWGRVVAYDSGFNAVFGHGVLDKIGQRESVHVIQGIPPAGQEIFCKVLLFLVKNFFMLKTAHTSSMTPKGHVPERKP